MKKNFYYLFLICMILISGVMVVRAEEKESLKLYEWFSTPLTKVEYYQYSSGKAEIFKDGLVSYRTDKSENITLNYYDLEGKVITSNTLEDIRFVIDMKTYDDYLYLLVEKSNYGVYLIKLDTKLNLVSTSQQIFSDSSINVKDYERFNFKCSTLGNAFLIFDKNKIYIYNQEPNKWGGYYAYKYYSVDYELENLVQLSNEESDNLQLYSYNMSTSISEDLKHGIAADYYFKYFGTSIGRIRIYDKNTGETKTIENEDYVGFSNVKIFNDEYIAVIGYTSLDENTESYNGEFLIYDMEGNIVFKKNNNTIPFYLGVYGNKLVYGDLYTDGICTWDMYYYEAESACDAYYSYHVYSLDAPVVEGDSSSTDNEKIENPNTKTSFVVITSLIVFCIGIFIVIMKSMSSFKFLK